MLWAGEEGRDGGCAGTGLLQALKSYLHPICRASTPPLMFICIFIFSQQFDFLKTFYEQDEFDEHIIIWTTSPDGLNVQSQ